MSEKDGMQGVHSVEISATNDVVYGSSHVGLRRVLTYGTYDLLHYGHIRLLQRAASLGDYLIVAFCSQCVSGMTRST